MPVLVDTRVGSRRWEVSPLPSLPLAPEPQHHAAASGAIAQVCWSPADTWVHCPVVKERAVAQLLPALSVRPVKAALDGGGAACTATACGR